MPKTTNRPELKPVNVGAAAIDIGSKMHMAAVDPACTDVPVRTFGTFTQDLHRLADWFKTCGVTSVAMESTGVYWIPVYEVLEQRGFEVILVNARYAKNVPGRKTDVSDAAWLRQLHSYGLLRGSFRPDAEIATLRAYLRQRERLVEYAAAHIQHMQKALMEMNLQLHHVVSDITGATGMRIIRAIVAGERNPDVLALYRDVRCHSSTETIRAALVGNDREEHVFALTQSLELYDIYQAKMLDCDRKLEVLVAALSNTEAKPVGKLSKPRVKTKQVNTPTFDVRTALYGVLGVDLTEIHGLGPSLALKLVGECGGSEGVAERQALHLLALPRTRQQNLRRQGAIFTHAEIFQPGSRTTAVGSHNRGAERYGARSILSPAVLTRGQVEGGDGDRPQDCSFILQHTPAWHELQGSRCGPI
jgi:transposase